MGNEIRGDQAEPLVRGYSGEKVQPRTEMEAPKRSASGSEADLPCRRGDNEAFKTAHTPYEDYGLEQTVWFVSEPGVTDFSVCATWLREETVDLDKPIQQSYTDRVEVCN